MTVARPSPRLEALAAFCLGATEDDCRLGDLSELHVRTATDISVRLAGVPGGQRVARLAADARYLAAAIEVMVFARAVDPGLQLYENGVAALVALNIREKAMVLLQVGMRRFALPAVLLACSALMLNNAVDAWRAGRQAEAAMEAAQRDRAETAARSIASFNSELDRVLGWAAYWFVGQPADRRHTSYVRLLPQQEPAIQQVMQLDGQGREQLVVNRYTADVIGSGIDHSTEAPFVGVRGSGRYIGPVHADRNGDPTVTIALAPRGMAAGAIVAEISLKAIQAAVAAARPQGGDAYVIDGEGRRLFPTAPGATGPVRTVSASVPGIAWKVVVAAPAAAYDELERNAAIRALATGGLALVAAALALVLALRPPAPIRPATA